MLPGFVRGERKRALCAQLAARYPECSDEQIEEAVQAACRCFLEEAEEISTPAQVYPWIRTAAHRILIKEAERRRRESPIAQGLERIAAEGAGPAQELISREDDADLTRLAREVADSLSERRRDVLALYGAGCKRPQIAERLGLTQRIVKRELLAVMEEARAALTRMTGGGCEYGEAAVMRFICGLSTPVEAARAREHLAGCERCTAFSERLLEWREKVPAVLPAPLAEVASPGVLERIAHGAAERLAAVKQQVLDDGAQLKQQATATYYRAVDPTPLAAARPGTVASVVASCLALGGGAATYCAERGVNPLGAAKGLIASAPEDPSPSTEPPEAASPAPVYAPADPPESEAPSAETTSSEADKAPEPKSEPSSPPPEDSYEPTRPAYMASESEGDYEASEAAPTESRQPAPVPPNSGPQFGGP